MRKSPSSKRRRDSNPKASGIPGTVEIIDSRFNTRDDSEAGRIAAWGKAGLLRDLGPSVSEDTGRHAAETFAIWSARAEAIDRRGPTAEAEMTRGL